jgi:hypothetical protein
MEEWWMRTEPLAGFRERVERCLDLSRAGQLTEADLLDLLDAIDAAADPRPRQSLLYLQATSSRPDSRVIGISIFEEGKDADGIDENGEILYRSVGEALRDGWRIVKFPDLVVAMDEQNNYGLGCEFILERWR